MIPVFIVGVTLLFSACNSKLADYQGKEISQKDMEEWVELFYSNQKKSILANLKYQQNIVRQIAIIDLASAKAKADKLMETDDFKQSWDLEERRLTLKRYNDYLRDEFKKKPDYSIDVVRARHILFKIPRTKQEGKKRRSLTAAEKDQEYKKALARSRKVYTELKANKKFADVAKELSEGPTKGKGGDLGFFTRKNMMAEPFAEAAFALEIGKVSKPVKTQFGYHVIKVEEKKTVTPQNLDQIFPQKHQKNRFERNVFRLHMESIQEKLKKEAEKLLDYDLLKKAGLKDVVFSYGTLKKTKDEFLRDYYRLFHRKTKIDQDKYLKVIQEEEAKFKRGIDYFNNLYLISEKAKKDSSWQQQANARLDQLSFNRFLSSFYFNNFKVSGMKVSEDEMKREYELRYKGPANKKRNTKGRKAKRPAQKVKPYSEVKDRIHDSLLRRKKNNYLRRQIDNLLKEANFKMYSDKFKVEKIDKKRK